MSQEQARFTRDEKAFQRRLSRRQLRGRVWSRLFLASIIVGLLALVLLVYNIVRQTFTLVVIENPVDPQSIADRSARELSSDDLIGMLRDNLTSARLQELILRDIAGAPPDEWRILQTQPLGEVLAGKQYPQELNALPFNALTAVQAATIFQLNMADRKAALTFLVADEVIKPSSRPIRELLAGELIEILRVRLTPIQLQELVIEEIAGTPPAQSVVARARPLKELLSAGQYPEAWQDVLAGQLSAEQSLVLVQQNFSQNALLRVVLDEVVKLDRTLEELTEAELVEVLSENINPDRLRVLILEQVVGATGDEWKILNNKALGQFLEEGQYPAELRDLVFNQLSAEQSATIFSLSLSRAEVLQLVEDEIVQPRVVDSWSLDQALLKRGEIDDIVARKYPNGKLKFRSWINWRFLTTPMHSRPELSGLRTAVLGSLWMMLITVAVAFPIGIGAAIYLEEYATDNLINRIIQINVTNLAGVPSIIYGILGLAVFVRFMGPITSGDVFGQTASATVSGRTVMSAGLTMTLLILPIVIINAQEAIRAVPPSLREASYCMGATKLQMIRTTILPNALPGIMTGTILAVSRAFGETAPLVVVGSITRITVDPDGPFSRFTAIPIQIYSWTSQPQDEFRSVAAAAILVLLAILLLFNSTAVILRNRFSKRW